MFAALGGEEACDSRTVSKSLPETERQGEGDPLYQLAVEFVLASSRASVSAIQRHFRIGYNRAAWLAEAMETGGVISKPDSQGLRKVIAKGAA
ncbi:DNA translocase FtsK [Aeromonas sp. ASNIH2]|uniref:DNA translocase FtsK n=1 Tax=Aeromonas sp. ASNIH2 TaxID=1636607 RepID=UPI002277617A|nr:DNA translocase FtsK [Aeromonas sp. ASNIH2]